MLKTISTLITVACLLFFAYLGWKTIQKNTFKRALPNATFETIDNDKAINQLENFKLSGNETVASVLAKLQTRVWDRLKEPLKQAGFDAYPTQIKVLAFKSEEQLEIYGLRNASWHLIKRYPFSGTSGQLGPKLRRGDRQIPEGLYQLEYLNPNSKFWLSAKVSYPNAFDKAKGKLDNRKQLGGDIFIHGKTQTIGCIPLGDGPMEEVFFLMAHHHQDQPLEIIISPVDFRTGEKATTTLEINWYNELCKKISGRLNDLPFAHSL